MKKILNLLLVFFAVNSVVAQDIMDAPESIPHVSKKAIDSFQFDYAYADMHRAFAIAPGGAWSWNSGSPTVEVAQKAALKSCNSFTQQTCILYSVDNMLVFDKEKWFKLWGPYKTAAEVKKLKTGERVGQIFPDVEFTNPQGKKQSIHQLNGKVRFVHFWGCWCPSCKYEFASLIDMYRIIQDTMSDQVEFIVLQGREPIEDARKWAMTTGLDALPLSDSGVKSENDKEFRLTGGKRVADRQLAKVFPASYVLDKHGVVVFSHMGSISNWTEFVHFFKDVVERSGK